MLLKDNPFYVLGVSLSANRRAIANAVEEMSFMLGADKCAEAQSVLLNPTKRLQAELDWLPETKAEEITVIRDCISNDQIIETETLAGCSKLNALIYNLSQINHANIYEFGFDIVEIDEQYENVDLRQITTLINSKREKAGISSVTENEVQEYYRTKIEDIRKLVIEKLKPYDEDSYIDFVTVVAEQYIADKKYTAGNVLMDIVDQYEVRIQSLLDDKTNQIKRYIGQIKALKDDNEIKKAVPDLIEKVKDWDTYAQPLQLRSQASGLPHETSKNLAGELRGVVLFLHNERHLTEEARDLASAMRSVFLELGELKEIFTKDTNVLDKMQKEKEEAEREKEEHTQPDVLYNVVLTGNQYSYPRFCTCCMKPASQLETLIYSTQTQRGNTRTTHTTKVQLPVCPECLEHRAKFKSIVSRVRVLSALIGVVATFAIMVLVKCKDIVAIIIGALIAVAAYFIIAAKKKLKALPKEHSARAKSVEISKYGMGESGYYTANSDTTTYFFSNWKYANMFHQANKERSLGLKEGKWRTNPAKETTLLATDETKGTTAFLVVSIFLIGAILLAAINSKETINNIFPNSPFAVTAASNSTRTTGTGSTWSNTTKKSTETKTTKPTTKPTAKPTAVQATKKETVFSSVSSNVNDRVYVDIKSVNPVRCIYYDDNSSLSSVLDSYIIFKYICECTTKDNQTVWVVFSAKDYQNEVDSSADSYVSKKNGYNADTVKYNPAARIHGTVIRTDTVSSGMSAKISSDKIIQFESLEIPNQYKDMTVTYYVTSIEPKFHIGTDGTTYTDVVCKCKTVDNGTSWVYMENAQYIKYFDSSAKLSKKGQLDYSVKRFSNSKIVSGHLYNANELAKGLADEIGQEMILVVTSVK